MNEPDRKLPESLLSQWRVPDPPGDLEARIFSVLSAEPWWRRWAPRLALAAACAACTVFVGARLLRASSHTLDVDGRVTVRLGESARVAREVLASNTLRYRQESGRASYDVLRGPVEVVSPDGLVSVKGTQFDVEVYHMKPVLMGVAAAATMVTVTAGQVLLSNVAGSLEVGPATTAVMTSSSAPRKVLVQGDAEIRSVTNDLLRAELALAATKKEVAELEATLHRQASLLKGHQESIDPPPTPWPAGLPPVLTPAQFAPEVARLLANGADGGVLAFATDCAEYPCAVALALEGGREDESETLATPTSLDALLKSAEATVTATRAECDGGTKTLIAVFAYQKTDGGLDPDSALGDHPRLDRRLKSLWAPWTCGSTK